MAMAMIRARVQLLCEMLVVRRTMAARRDACGERWDANQAIERVEWGQSMAWHGVQCDVVHGGGGKSSQSLGQAALG